MNENGKKMAIPVCRAEDLPVLKDKRLEFESVAQMLTVRAEEIPDKVHVIFYDQKITYSEMNRRSNRVANYLREKGVRKGAVVSQMILNSPEIYYTLFGCQKLGAVSGIINFALTGPEIAHVLDDSKPEIVFVGSEFMAPFLNGYNLADHKPLVVEVVTGIEHSCNLAECTLTDILETFPDDEALVPQSPDDPFLLLYSSGTTGRPKGILLSNRGQLEICRGMATIGLFTSDEDIMLLLLPMFHINPIGVWTYPVMYMGQTVCIRKAFSPQDFWPAILDNGVTILMGVPAMYNYVYYSIDAAAIDRARLKLKYAFCGAAPLSVELIEGFKEKFGVEIIEGYGLTEANGVSVANPPLGKRKAGSCGVAMPGVEVEIMDLAGNILPQGRRGEVCIRGNSTMIEYLNNPDATKESFIGGWLRTGDIGIIDEEGFLTIVDRAKDMINRGGENIYPREIEIAIESHPMVLSVAVIGVHDNALGERVKAVIEPTKPDSLTSEMIRDYLKDKLAKYKIPEFVDIVEKLPRSQTGKVLKYKLRETE